jgi:hypothetical protein
MPTTRTGVLTCACGVALVAAAAAQQPAPPLPGRGPAAQPVEAHAPAPAYAYDPQGRRDPFVSLLARGSDQRQAGPRPTGPGGLLVADVTVKGIIRDRSGFIAMVQGSDTKTFIVRPGEKLMDGLVKAITADSVVFSQDVDDPLSTVKQKEVRKSVRSADGGRG